MKTILKMIIEDFRKPIPLSAAVFLVLTGIVMGSIFTVGEYYWRGPVKKEDARVIKAVFIEYEVVGDRSKYVIIRVENHDQMNIDTYCTDRVLIAKLEGIKHGSVVDLVVHPRSNTILELKNGIISYFSLMNR